MSWLCPACDSSNSEEYSEALGLDPLECYACGWEPSFSADETEEHAENMLEGDDMDDDDDREDGF